MDGHGAERRQEFKQGASQYLQMGTGPFSSLSRIQFGSTSLSGKDLNAKFDNSITLGKLTGPLPHSSTTVGTYGQLTSWTKNGPLPFTSETAGTTFSFRKQK